MAAKLTVFVLTLYFCHLGIYSESSESCDSENSVNTLADCRNSSDCKCGYIVVHEHSVCNF